MGRTYGNIGAGFKDLAFDASSGLPPYLFGLPWAFRAPNANGVVPSAVGHAHLPVRPPPARAVRRTISASAGDYPFSVTLDDTANASTPSALASVTQPLPIPGSITINPALAFTVNAGSVNPPPLGVVNRTYGNVGAGFRALVYDAGGGIPAGTGYTITLPSSVAAPSADGVPSPVACGSNAEHTQVTCSGGASAMTAVTGSYPFSVTLDDTANSTTPSGSQSVTTNVLSKSIAINGQLAINLPIRSLSPTQ